MEQHQINDSEELMDYEEDEEVDVPKKECNLNLTENAEETDTFNYERFYGDCNNLTEQPQNQQEDRIRLRGYQEELAANAKEGKNVIICAPPGSGKTIVAASIVEDYLDKNVNSGKKVLFFTPTGALAQQQQKKLSGFMSGEYTCEFRCGQDENANLMLVAEVHVIVLTPQILLNEIESKDELKTFKELDEFGLFIFDECHHCFKGHPYNAVMRKYFALKNNREKKSEMPQIVGLTATLGVGKNPKNVIKHMKKLCANLDALDGIDTVTNEDHLKELDKFSPIPKKELLQVEERSCKDFLRHIISLLNQLLEIIKRLEVGSDPPSFDAGEEVHRQELIQWCKTQRNVFGHSDETNGRDAFSCVEYIEVCDNALDLYKKCRPIDSVTCFDDYLKPKEECKEKLSQLELHILDITRATEMRLRNLCHDPSFENPNLKKIEKLIVATFEENDDSKGLLLVETREYAQILLKWMNDTEKLKSLNPQFYVGIANKSGTGISGLSHLKQELVLKNFREGNHKMLVCTRESIGEGMDFDDCNLVIKYHVTENEIGMLQTEGRVRKKDGALYDLTTAQGERRDQLNTINADWMYDAVAIIQEEFISDIAGYRNDLIKLQEEARVKDKIDLLKKLRRQSVKTDEEFQLQCKKCKIDVCKSSELRVACGGHHIVTKEGFEEKYKQKIHKRISSMGNEWRKKNKIHCKECDHDWGIEATWNSVVTVPLLKAESLLIISQTTNRKYTPKKWVLAPFKPQSVDLLHEYLLDTEQQDNE